MNRHILTPEEAELTKGNVLEDSRGLSFGVRAWMPGINIEGRSYSMAYEEMTGEHLQGIPVRHNGRLIGHMNTDTDGKGTVTLLPGESMPEVDHPPTEFSVTSMVPSCQAIVLESIAKGFERFSYDSTGLKTS